MMNQGDQIAFNNILARFGVIWHDATAVSVMHLGNTARTGILLWSNQTNHSGAVNHLFVSDFARQKLQHNNVVVTSSNKSLKIKLLAHHAVMRYCEKRGDISYDLVPFQYTALHCYDSTRVPSAGWRRAHLKAVTFQWLNLWVLKVMIYVIS